VQVLIERDGLLTFPGRLATYHGMTDRQDTSNAPNAAPPAARTQQEAEKQARAGRVAAALRANLLRRKQQARARSARDDAAADSESSAEISIRSSGGLPGA
jgi:hypothetical protein